MESSSLEGCRIPTVQEVAQEHFQDETMVYQIHLLLNDWTAQVQASAANPAWAQEQFAQWQLLHQQYQHLQYQQQLVATSTTDPWQVLPEDDGSTGDRWSMDTRTDRIGV